MKVKLVLKLDCHDDKGKRKALKTVSGLQGVDSISMDMKYKKMTVVAGVDPVEVVGKLRKSGYYPEILSVRPAKEEKKDEGKRDEGKKDEGKMDVQDKKKTQEKQLTMYQEPSVLVSSSSRRNMLAARVRFIDRIRSSATYLRNKLSAINKSVNDLDGHREVDPENSHLQRDTCGPVSNQQGMHPSLQDLASQAYSWDTSVGDPILPGGTRICISSGAEEEPFHRVRLENSDLKTVVDQLSLVRPTGRLPEKYPKKLVDVPLILYPSRSLALNLRAECLAAIYLPGSNDALLEDLVNLKQLDLSYSSFTRMPDLSGAHKLPSIDLHGCINLVDVSSIQYLTKLEYINLRGCTSLMSLPSPMALKFLSSLDVSDCKNLRKLPPSLGCLSSLTTLDIRNCKKIPNLPRAILRLKSLQTLSISGCSMLMEHMSRVDTSTSVNPALLYPPCSQSDHSSKVKGFEVPSYAELSSMYQPESNYSFKPSLEQPEEERMCNETQSPERRTSYEMSTGSEDATKSSSTTQNLELVPLAYPPVTCQPYLSSDDSNVNFTPDSLAQYREALKGYMNMPVEDIHGANAYHDVQTTVESLIQQSSNSNGTASLQDLLCFMEEHQENVPETMAQLCDSQLCITSLPVKLERLGSSFVRAEEQYHLLAAKLLVISEEEDEVDADIRRLLAKRQELLDEQNIIVA